VAAAACFVALIAVWILYFKSTERVEALPQSDLIVVEKSNHTMTLFRDGKVLKTYSVALGRGGGEQKELAGDNRVPEGLYRIVGRNPHSAFHLALKVGYPTSVQRLKASLRGVDPGGDIMVHGIRNGLGWIGQLHRSVDWTRGCIAVTDAEIEEVWNAVSDGTPIEIQH
jgi:murein L,D-transpeptidase YafK